MVPALSERPYRDGRPGRELIEPLDARDLERFAEAHLPRAVFDFAAGGADDERVVAENEAAYARYRLVPRVLRDVQTVSTAVNVLGLDLRAPILVAPAALHGMFHPEAERGMARGAGAAGLAMVLSSASSQSIEDVFAEPGCRWFQLYVFRDRGIVRDLVAHAVAAGASALCLTVDAPVPGARRRDIVNDFAGMPGIHYGSLDRYLSAAVSTSNMLALDPTVTWVDVERLREESGLPVVVKGVMSPADARLAVQHGAAAVVVSNHGGRQLGNAPATIDVLSGIVEAVGGEVDVLVDGGVRRATDIAVALCLGARAVLLGRPALWALAYNGAEGVQRYLAGLIGELERAMTLLGARSIAELDRSYLHPGSGER